MGHLARGEANTRSMDYNGSEDCWKKGKPSRWAIPNGRLRVI